MVAQKTPPQQHLLNTICVSLYNVASAVKLRELACYKKVLYLKHLKSNDVFPPFFTFAVLTGSIALPYAISNFTRHCHCLYHTTSLKCLSIYLFLNHIIAHSSLPWLSSTTPTHGKTMSHKKHRFYNFPKPKTSSSLLVTLLERMRAYQAILSGD